MELHTGDPCPCCGKPIKFTDPDALRLLGMMAELLGLEAAGECVNEECGYHNDRACPAASACGGYVDKECGHV